jgi:hypothetical protein
MAYVHLTEPILTRDVCLALPLQSYTYHFPSLGQPVPRGRDTSVRDPSSKACDVRGRIIKGRISLSKEQNIRDFKFGDTLLVTQVHVITCSLKRPCKYMNHYIALKNIIFNKISVLTASNDFSNGQFLWSSACSGRPHSFQSFLPIGGLGLIL